MDEEKEARIPEIALPEKTADAASEFLAPEVIDANLIEEKSDKTEELIAESPLTDNTEEKIPENTGNPEIENIGESDNLSEAVQEELVEKNNIQPEHQTYEEKSVVDFPVENTPEQEQNIEEAQSIENESVQEESLYEQPVEEQPAGEHPFPEKSLEEQPVDQQPIEAIAEIQEIPQQIAQEQNQLIESSQIDGPSIDAPAISDLIESEKLASPVPEDISLPSAKDIPSEEKVKEIKEEENSVEKETLADNIEGFEKLTKDQQEALLKYVREHVQIGVLTFYNIIMTHR